MNNAILNDDLIAVQAGNIVVYNYDGETREYISESTEYLAVVLPGRKPPHGNEHPQGPREGQAEREVYW